MQLSIIWMALILRYKRLFYFYFEQADYIASQYFLLVVVRHILQALYRCYRCGVAHIIGIVGCHDHFIGSYGAYQVLQCRWKVRNRVKI